MVFNGDGVQLLLVIILILWTSTLTYLLLRTKAHYNRLTRDITKHDLTSVLERILEREQELQTSSKKLEKDVATLAHDGAFHLSRLGLVRFNPFLDTGGSQSFTLAILDSRDNGLVMTSLYARTGNRWYVKEIRGGKAKGVELSKEEMAAIQRAQPIQEQTV
jgi:hypothetical protein